MGAVTIGVDIGQKQNPTALSVVEHEWREGEGGRGEVHHLVRHLEKMPLGSPYPRVAQRVREICSGVRERTPLDPTLYVDATGVGTPVVDLIETSGVQAWIVPVYFTHGDRRSVQDGEVRLGKAWLVSRLQTLLQSGLLHLPRTPEAADLGRELLDYEIRVSDEANDRYGVFRVVTHD